MSLAFSRFEVLTLDCYGTLVDWETGIFSVLKPILQSHGKLVSDAKLLELYGELEAEVEAGPYISYREVLCSVVRDLGKRLSFTPTVEEVNLLPLSVPRWRTWPDSVAALHSLAERFRLAIISNIDDELFEATRTHLRTEFQSVTTAEQAQCYKPGLDIFRKALSRVGVERRAVRH